MSEVVKGINTAGIKYNDRLFALALKIKDENSKCSLIYMQLNVLIDLIIILKNRQRIVYQRVEELGENYQQTLVTASTSLANNVPEIIEKDVQEPDTGNRVLSLALKAQTDSFKIIALLQNEKIVTLHIDDLQVEFILLTIQQALNSADDKATMHEISYLLDFLMLYVVDFSDMEKISYRETHHEVWKQRLFSHYLAVLYCFETEQGKKILSGAVLKTSAPHQSEDEKNIIVKMATLNSQLKELQKKHQLCQYFCYVIPSEQNQVLTLDECLRSLDTFCLDTQAKLNA